MRLTESQRQQVCRVVDAHLGRDAVVSGFGSRLDDSGRGGDLDILSETDTAVPLLKRAALKMALERALMRRVDMLSMRRGQRGRAFQTLAQAQSEPLQRRF